MFPGADELVSDARSNIRAGRLLLASDAILQSAQYLVNADPCPDPELQLEIFWLRGVVARDRHSYEPAIVLLDQARALAQYLGRWGAVAELSLAKANVANLALNPQLSGLYLSEARRELERTARAPRRVLFAEIIARRVQCYELTGDLDSAEQLATSALDRCRRIDSPDILVSRLATLSRIRATRLGRPCRQVERWLDEAREPVAATGSVLRELQWRTALAHHLQLSRDPGITQELQIIRRLLALGQLRHRPSESMLSTHGIPLPPTSGVMREEASVTYNFGGSGHNISIGSMNVHQFSSHGAEGDRGKLWDALRGAGVGEDELADLEKALGEDEKLRDPGTHSAGPHVTKWYRSLLAKGGSTSGKIAIGAAGGVLGKALAAYLGI